MRWNGTDDEFWAAVADYSLTPRYEHASEVLQDVLNLAREALQRRAESDGDHE
jgi:hypothetical protein